MSLFSKLGLIGESASCEGLEGHKGLGSTFDITNFPKDCVKCGTYGKYQDCRKHWLCKWQGGVCKYKYKEPCKFGSSRSKWSGRCRQDCPDGFTRFSSYPWDASCTKATDVHARARQVGREKGAGARFQFNKVIYKTKWDKDKKHFYADPVKEA